MDRGKGIGLEGAPPPIDSREKIVAIPVGEN